MNPHTQLAITLTLAPVVLTLGYGIGCWLFPFKDCTKCKGRGKNRSPMGRALRYCRACNGSGLRLRIGRKVWGALVEHRTRATTATRASQALINANKSPAVNPPREKR